MILYVSLGISILLNALLIWYLREVAKRFFLYEAESERLLTILDEYIAHLGSVYQMSMFYGDETLKSLMEHAVSFREQIDTFEYIYSLTEQEVSENTPDEKEEEE